MKTRLKSSLWLLLLPLSFVPALVFAQESAENVGVRPYEMDWAGRTEEVRDALVDFESLDGWKVETTNSIVTFERSREEQMYGKYVGKLTYRSAQQSGEPVVDIRPPQPIAIPDKNFDAFSCWIVGNNWGWTTDPTTPRVRVSAIFRTTDGKELPLPLETIDWHEWFLCYKVVSPENQAKLGNAPTFDGFRIAGGSNVEDRTLYFDSFCAFKEDRKPLEFKLRAKPGIDLFDGQPLGINAGEGRLPFPTNEDTILPDSEKKLRKPAMHFYGDYCDFVYEGDDGTLVYVYKPNGGDWSDVTACWNDCKPIYPCREGGVKSLVGENGETEAVEKAELLELKPYDRGVRALWRLSSKTATADVEYRLQLRGKSLIVDTIALGGRVPSVSLGWLEGIKKAKVFSIPYYLYDYGRRPGVALFYPTDSDQPLFASAHIDWYRSGASYLSGRNGAAFYEKDVRVGKPGEFHMEKQAVEYAYLNGSADYRTKTDGARNDVYERFIFTITPDFDETLPSIANPKSPYRAVAGKGVWRSHGASTRDGDKKYWYNVWRRGMKHIIVTDHEVCWRDGGESFTFRTKPAPQKGGDEGWFDYSRFMQDKLGFVYGPYNNFTDFAPVNEYWSPDMISRLQDGSLQRAWMRCYAPKPTRAVEYCEKLTPINEEKFKFSCAYCDVHSSVPAWTRTDYDARVPGAGTFMSVFYPYGEIFLLQKQNWGGPTYSEGPHHCFYAGLTDGNYAQDQPYNLFKNPWLLNFDLLKIHEQEVDFGMGNTGMFAPGYSPKPEERVDFVDRFLAATLAFGHSGFFASDFGWETTARSYFMIQQIAARYTQASVESIRYFDQDGNALDTSAALVADVVKRSQVCVKYQDGTVVVSNGSTKENLKTKVDDREIELPPNGYVAWTADDQILVESFLSDSGARFDYCESPEYIYFDGRGVQTTRNRACGSGSAVCLILEDGRFELIPNNDKEVGFKLADESETVEAVALDYDGNELGAAKVKRARGFVYVEPVENAVSYILTKKPRESGDVAEWKCDRMIVARGETLQLTKGDQTIEWVVPVDATYGRFWAEPVQGEFLDFDVEPFVKPSFQYDSKTNELTQTIETALPRLKVDGNLKFNDLNWNWTLDFGAGKFVQKAPLPPPTQEGVETARPEYVSEYSGEKTVISPTLTFETKEQFVRFEQFEFGDSEKGASDSVAMKKYVQRRDKEATQDLAGTSATAHFDGGMVCGGVSKPGLFVHPPYGGGGTGRTILRYDFEVPNEPASFSLSVGKRDGSDLGDGIVFKVSVAQFNDADKLIEDSEKTLAETVVKEHGWLPLRADLSEYAGQKITALVSSDAGENPNGDWACVAELRVESANKEFVRTLKSVE